MAWAGSVQAAPPVSVYTRILAEVTHRLYLIFSASALSWLVKCLLQAVTLILPLCRSRWGYAPRPTTGFR
jgi:hypothetical protein